MPVLRVADHRARRNKDDQIFGRRPVAIRGAAGLAVLGLPKFYVGQGGKAVDAFLGQEDHAAAVAAVAAVGTAAGHEFFPAETDATVTPFARLNLDFHFIDKRHRFTFLKVTHYCIAIYDKRKVWLGV